MVVVADHTKWGKVALSSFARLEDVDTLVTDSGVSDEVRTAMAEHLPGLVVAGRGAPGAGGPETGSATVPEAGNGAVPEAGPAVSAAGAGRAGA